MERLPKSHLSADPPWLIIAWPGKTQIRLDVGILDRIAAADSDLMLSVGDYAVAIHIADGLVATHRLLDQLAPYSRNAQINQEPVFDIARRRLQQYQNRESSLCRLDLEVGSDPITLRKDLVIVGGVAYRMSDVEMYADNAANIPLSDGTLLQAALVMLAIAATKRDAIDEISLLQRRIAEFESKSQ